MSVLEAAGPNATQITYWNEVVGPTWVAMQDALDTELGALGEQAMDLLAPKPGEHLLDIGCGCGATTLALAQRVGPTGAVTGADISAPMLAVARERAGSAGLAQARFVQADAQTCDFEPVDGAFSRFGVMFFAGPAAAFANIRRTLKPGGRLAFVCWQALELNPWMTVPLAAITPLLPARPPPPVPGAPGPFAFADGERLRGLLAEAGFTDISITANRAQIGWGDLDTSVATALRVGPVGVAARENPDLRPQIKDAVRAALTPYAGGDGVKLESGSWLVRAA